MQNWKKSRKEVSFRVLFHDNSRPQQSKEEQQWTMNTVIETSAQKCFQTLPMLKNEHSIHYKEQTEYSLEWNYIFFRLASSKCSFVKLHIVMKAWFSFHNTIIFIILL